MTQVLSVNVSLVPNGTLSNTIDYAVAVDNAGRYKPNSLRLTNGSSVLQANTWAILATTVAPSGSWNIDLTNLSNLFGSVNLTKVKVLILSLDNPDGNLYVNVSPTGGNNFTGIPTGTEQVYSNYYKENGFAGWGVSAGNSGITVANPTASAVAISGWICGIK